MTITQWDDFVKLPVGTIFSFYEPDIVYSLCRKGSNIDYEGDVIDFFYSTIIAKFQNEEPILTETETRYALFDSASFLVYSNEDIFNIANHLIK